MDTSKEFGINYKIFHLRDDEVFKKLGKQWLSKTIIQPIIYLSRLLISAEKNY